MRQKRGRKHARRVDQWISKKIQHPNKRMSSNCIEFQDKNNELGFIWMGFQKNYFLFEFKQEKWNDLAVSFNRLSRKNLHSLLTIEFLYVIFGCKGMWYPFTCGALWICEQNRILVAKDSGNIWNVIK